MEQNNFPDSNLCQFNKGNKKPDCKRSKHWHNCTDGPVEMPIIEEVDSGYEVGDNVWGDKNHVEDEKHDKLLNVFPLSTV